MDRDERTYTVASAISTIIVSLEALVYGMRHKGLTNGAQDVRLPAVG